MRKLTDDYKVISNFRENIKMESVISQWKQNTTEDAELTAELIQLESAGKEEIEERFCSDLTFGTGGLRGVLGAGTNRMNICTVGKATQGLADYLKKQNREPKVAIAYDSRKNSEKFARHTAGILAVNKIRVFLYPKLMPTPALSFAVRHLKCDAGICVTASHNPAEYNGYKVYGPDGCQITELVAGMITKEIEKIDLFRDVRKSEFTPQIGNYIHWISEETVEAYIDAVFAQRLSGNEQSDPALSIVYTPLNGAGKECVLRCLERAGYSDITLVSQQSDPDGNFPTCPYPNPEEDSALSLGMELMKKNSADLLLATDPDCDRVGVVVHHKDRMIRLNGDEIGALLFQYICRIRRQKGKMPLRPVAVKTIVTTDLAQQIADTYGVELRNVLTGFKYIGEQIGTLEKSGEEERYIFGFEESCGYLSGTYVRDKDGVDAALLICDMAEWYRQQGKTLVDVLEELYRSYGCWLTHLDSMTFSGEHGKNKIEEIMRRMRVVPPQEIAGRKVRAVRDFLWNPEEPSIHVLPSSNVLQILLEDEALVTIRPSGTEPKIKIYYQVKGKDKADGRRQIENLSDGINYLFDFAEI